MHFKTRKECEENGRMWKATLPREGRGWELVVRANMGWYWCLRLGPLSVYQSGGRPGNEFHALLAGNVSETGDGRWSVTGASHARSPLAAAKKALGLYRAYAKKTRAEFDEMDTFFGERATSLGACPSAC